MKRFLLAFLLSLAVTCAQEHGAAHAKAAVAHGEGHEEKPMENEIWWKWANFAILAAGLGFLIAKNAGPFFRARTAEIQNGIREAAVVRAEAEAKAADIEKRIGNLNAEVAAVRQKSSDEMTRESERVRAETAVQIEKIQKQSEAEIAAAGKRARQELKAFSATLALDLAERQIAERLTPETQTRLTDSFVDNLRGKAGLN